MHHALCIIGNFEDAYQAIPEVDRTLGLDVSVYRYAQCTIDDARALTYISTQRPIQHTYRVFILEILSATLEAQNALLKLFEEPADTSRFYIIIPFVDVLIPTVRSRLMIQTVKAERDEYLDIAKTFLQKSFNERLLTIAEKTKEKDDAWCDALIRAIEAYVQQNPEKGAEDLLFVEKYFRGGGASKKMLLEHLALSL